MRTVLWAVSAFVVLGTGAATAQMMHNHGGMAMSPPSSHAQSAPAEGIVRKVDRASGHVLLKHGPLESLGMPPMTMEYSVKDAKLLANVKEGDKVRFTPAQAPDGTLLVTSLEVIKS